MIFKTDNIPSFFLPHFNSLTQLPPYERGAVIQHFYYEGNFEYVQQERQGSRRTGYHYYKVVVHDQSGKEVRIEMTQPTGGLLEHLRGMVDYWKVKLFMFVRFDLHIWS